MGVNNRPVTICLMLAIALVLCVHGDAKRKPHHLKNYHRVFGADCVQHPYVWRFPFTKSRRVCAKACNSVKDCQAFTVMAGHCRMFVFNKCSKNVRSCSCNKFALMYVKRQPGLRPGALCPADFAYNRCGVKFKFTRPASLRWDSAMASCSAERGLSIMAEPIDRPRYDYLARLYDTRIWRPGKPRSYWLGGKQDPGSPEPGGNWMWRSCRIPINPSLWQRGEPNNHSNKEDYTCTWRHLFHMMNDCPVQIERFVKGGFCECVSPFDID